MNPSEPQRERVVDIVLFEDDPALVEVLSYHFTKAKYEFTHTQTCAQFWEALHSSRMRIIIVEPALLTTDDRSAFREWHKRTNIPVIFVTVDPRQHNVKFSVDLGVVAFAAKPFKLTAFLALVAQAIESLE